MQIRPRAAAVILNDQKELLLLRQKNPYTGFEWWTLPGGGMEAEESVIDTIVREVQEECNVACRPMKLLYVSEYVDYELDTHHLGMFFLTRVDDIENIKAGIDPEVEVQYIKECKFVSKQALKASHLPIYPPVFREQFWKDLENDFQNHEIYQRGMLEKK